LSDSILIGADTKLVSIMTRICIIGTSAARGEVGIKDHQEFLPLKPPVLEFVLPVLLVLAFMAMEQPVLEFPPLRQLVMEFILPVLLVVSFMAMEQPVLEFAPLG